MHRLPRKLTLLSVSLLLLVAGMASILNADGWRRRAWRSGGIPDRTYRSTTPRLRATVASHPAHVADVAGESRKQRRLFQPLETELAVEDCRLVNLRLIVYSDGRYLLSGRAVSSAAAIDQTTATQPASAGSADKIVPLRHRRLQISVRLFTEPEEVEPPDRKRAGGVEIAHFTIPPFHIAPGEELPVSFTSDVTLIPAARFHQLDQAEFELEIDPPHSVWPARRTSAPGVPSP